MGLDNVVGLGGSSVVAGRGNRLGMQLGNSVFRTEYGEERERDVRYDVCIQYL